MRSKRSEKRILTISQQDKHHRTLLRCIGQQAFDRGMVWGGGGGGGGKYPKPHCTEYSPPPPEAPMTVASYFSTIFFLNLPALFQHVNMVSSHRCAIDSANCLPSKPAPQKSGCHNLNMSAGAFICND